MQFMYLNHRGETSERHVKPIALLYLGNPGDFSKYLSGYLPGVFIEALDMDRAGSLRHFALSNILKNIDPDVGINDFRLPIPADGLNPLDVSKSLTDGPQREAYMEGFKAGHDNELFDFDATTRPTGGSWAHGYNDGRRLMLDDTGGR